MNLKATNKTETNKYELEIEVPAEDFNKAIDEVFKTEGKKITIPGFRRGKAPKAFIEKYYGESVFFEAAVDRLYRPALMDAVEASGLEVISIGQADITEVSKANGVQMKVTVVVKPEITIEGYRHRGFEEEGRGHGRGRQRRACKGAGQKLQNGHG